MTATASRPATLINTLRSAPVRLARRLFRGRAPAKLKLTDPLHSNVPPLRGAEIAAIYHGYRVAGDFYEFLRVNGARVLFGLFDIAGRREDTREILIAAQHTFRTLGPKLFATADLNEAMAMIELREIFAGRGAASRDAASWEMSVLRFDARPWPRKSDRPVTNVRVGFDPARRPRRGDRHFPDRGSGREFPAAIALH